jgi:hypothetical protein
MNDTTTSSKLYRVVVSSTGSYQGRRSSTFWHEEVLYCGPSVTDARIAYHKSRPGDFGGNPGNPMRETEFQAMDQSGIGDSDPGEFDTCEA